VADLIERADGEIGGAARRNRGGKMAPQSRANLRLKSLN
jgi:hypothetical protein